jgi:hypothetical protein
MNAPRPIRNDAAVPAAQRDPVRELATLLHLSRRAREAASIEALGFVMVNETRQLFSYRQAALARRSALVSKLPAEILAVSGVPQPDTQAPYVHWLGQALRHLVADAKSTAFSFNASALPDLPARDWSEWLPTHALAMPLPGPDAQTFGYVVIARDEPWTDRDLLLATELAHAYGFALARFVAQRSWRDRSQIVTWSKQHRWKLAAAIVAICLLPVQLTVLAPAEVVPSEPFLVRAPLDGVVDRFHVRPNQSVKTGDPLFDLDTTSLQARSSVARKAYDVAAEEYRQAAQLAVTDERSKLEMLMRKGQLEEKALEMEYSQQLLDRVRVKAARDGVAVFADQNDWQGRAVSIGERVLTLADPDKVELSIALAVKDAIELQTGSEVTLYPNGSALSSFDASLKSIAYRAEPTPDGQLAYRHKADFDSKSAAPRIGMMGTAKLRAGRVPLIYFALRRPLAATRQWLGW